MSQLADYVHLNTEGIATVYFYLFSLNHKKRIKDKQALFCNLCTSLKCNNMRLQKSSLLKWRHTILVIYDTLKDT